MPCQLCVPRHRYPRGISCPWRSPLPWSWAMEPGELVVGSEGSQWTILRVLASRRALYWMGIWTLSSSSRLVQGDSSLWFKPPADIKKSYVLVLGPCNKTQLLFWCQHEVWINVMCHPVDWVIFCFTLYIVGNLLPSSGTPIRMPGFFLLFIFLWNKFMSLAGPDSTAGSSGIGIWWFFPLAFLSLFSVKQYTKSLQSHWKDGVSMIRNMFVDSRL